jgi:hypothetical protein
MISLMIPFFDALRNVFKHISSEQYNITSFLFLVILLFFEWVKLLYSYVVK